MFEYVLLKGINDSEKDALELAHLLQGIPCKLNLIPYNETDGKYRRPEEDVIARFSEILHEKRETPDVIKNSGGFLLSLSVPDWYRRHGSGL